MCGSGQGALPDVREWLGVPPGCPGVIREALPNIREWLGGPPEYPKVAGSPSRMVDKPSRMSSSCRDALPDVRKWSGGPP